MRPVDPHRKRRSRFDLMDRARAEGRPLTPEEGRKLFTPTPPTEHSQQVAFVRWARDPLTLAALPALANLTAVPHAEQSKAQAGKKVAEGVSAGYPDLLLDEARGGYFGWRCEMKRRGERPRKSQEDWIARLRAAGYYVIVAYSADEAKLDVTRYLSLPPTDGGIR